jgi:hypothetical protein
VIKSSQCSQSRFVPEKIPRSQLCIWERLYFGLFGYRRRHCIVPVDGFFEWKAIKGQKAKQPYAIAMKDGRPFGIGGLWENRKEPTSGEWIGTRCVARSCAPNKPRPLSLSPNKQRANKHLDG